MLRKFVWFEKKYYLCSVNCVKVLLGKTKTKQ